MCSSTVLPFTKYAEALQRGSNAPEHHHGHIPFVLPYSSVLSRRWRHDFTTDFVLPHIVVSVAESSEVPRLRASEVSSSADTVNSSRFPLSS